MSDTRVYDTPWGRRPLREEELAGLRAMYGDGVATETDQPATTSLEAEIEAVRAAGIEFKPQDEDEDTEATENPATERPSTKGRNR